MLPPPGESPADEYERRFADERKRARQAVKGWANWSLGTHAVIPALFGACGPVLFLGGVSSDVENAFMVLVIATAFGLLTASFITAAFAGVTTLRSWSALPWLLRLYGLTPWLVFATECALGLAMFL